MSLPGAEAGVLFSRFEWGEYLTWLLGPRFPVFMDGRIEIFPDEVWAQYSTVTVGRAQWHEVLNRYAVDYLLLDAPYHGRRDCWTRWSNRRSGSLSFAQATPFSTLAIPPNTPPSSVDKGIPKSRCCILPASYQPRASEGRSTNHCSRVLSHYPRSQALPEARSGLRGSCFADRLSNTVSAEHAALLRVSQAEPGYRA